MNSVLLVGRLTKDGDFRETESSAVYKFTLAVDREFKQDGGAKADFPRVVVFGKSAENCNKYLSKGKMVAVRGRIQTGSYEDKDGKTVYTTDVIADRVEFLSPSDKGEKHEEDSYLQLNEDVPF